MELFFIYDSHCPWSYAATPLVAEIMAKFPDTTLHAWHSAHFQGDEQVNAAQIAQVKQHSSVPFTSAYEQQLNWPKDSVLVANVMAWLNQKMPQQTLALLQALQQAHFQQGQALTVAQEIEPILSQLKLSPPAKAMKHQQLSKEAEYVLQDVFQMQELIGTEAIPALLLALGDNLILLNHNLYLNDAKAIIEAVTIERNKYLSA